MISAALRRLSRRHPGAALAITAAVLIGGTGLLLWMTIRDLNSGHLLRPIGVLLVLILIAIRLAATGFRRRV